MKGFGRKGETRRRKKHQDRKSSVRYIWRPKDTRNHFDKVSYDVFGYIMGFIPGKLVSLTCVCKKWNLWVHDLPVKLRPTVEGYDNFDNLISRWKKIVGLELRGLIHRENFDFSFLAQCSQIKFLSATSNYISDITSLSHCKNLEMLDLRSTYVSDISSLAECKNLKHLYLESTFVRDITPLAECLSLEILNLCKTEVADLSPISGCSNIEILNIARTKSEDLSPLMNLKKITILDMRCCIFVKNVSFISELSSLKQLYISGTEIRDLDPITTCGTLEEIRIMDDEYDYYHQKLAKNMKKTKINYDDYDEWYPEDICESPHCLQCRILCDEPYYPLKRS
jgi:hypothetical protein